MYFSRCPEMTENVGRKINSLVNLEQALRSVLSMKLIAMITRGIIFISCFSGRVKEAYQG